MLFVIYFAIACLFFGLLTYKYGAPKPDSLGDVIPGFAKYIVAAVIWPLTMPFWLTMLAALQLRESIKNSVNNSEKRKENDSQTPYR